MGEWLTFARGPLFRICLAFMVLGLARHFLLTLWEVLRSRHRAGDRNIDWRRVARTTGSWLAPFSRFKESRLYGATSLTMHLGILVLVPFLAGHASPLGRALGLDWPALPAWLADLLALTILASMICLALQRRLDPMRRVVSRHTDQLLLALLAAPVATGFFAGHPTLNPISHQGMLLAHALTADLVLVLIPLTKLSHMVIMPLSRAVAVVGWRFPATSGSETGAALGKEDEPI